MADKIIHYKAGVYQIRNIKNGKRYIGSTENLKRRWSNHRRVLKNDIHHSIILQRAWNKYGKDAFAFEVLWYCNSENCLMYEQIALDHYKPEYNIALIAIAPMKGRRHTEDTKLKIRKNRHTLEAKRRIGMAQKKEKNSQWNRRGELSPNYGKKRSFAVRKKIKEAQQGESGNNAKLREAQVYQIKAQLAQNISISQIAVEYDVSISTIYDIKSQRTWSHLSC